MTDRDRLDSAAVELTDEQFEELLALARLEVDAEQRLELAGDLRALLGFVEELFSAPLPETLSVDSAANAEPTSGRTDVVAPSLAREAALSNAPAVHDGYFKVPRTVEES